MAIPRSSVARGELRLEGAERATPGPQRRALQSAWTAGIPDGEWAVYDSAIKALRATGRPFMLGGAFGLATYTGRWRNTKDLDLYVLPQDREILAEALASASFTDHFPQLEYQRHWIYRASKEDCIVDLSGRWRMSARWSSGLVCPRFQHHDSRREAGRAWSSFQKSARDG